MRSAGPAAASDSDVSAASVGEGRGRGADRGDGRRRAATCVGAWRAWGPAGIFAPGARWSPGLPVRASPPGLERAILPATCGSGARGFQLPSPVLLPLLAGARGPRLRERGLTGLTGEGSRGPRRPADGWAVRIGRGCRHGVYFYILAFFLKFFTGGKICGDEPSAQR
jgi:hypothetical protein